MNQHPATDSGTLPLTVTASAVFLWVLLGVLSPMGIAQAERTASIGHTIYVELDSAPFPHASRSAGYTRRETFYSAEEHYSDSTVMIFTPEGYHPGETVDVLVYFHGHGNHVRRSVEEFGLREQLVNSGRQLVLVFPQGPYDVPDSSAGKLGDDDGLKSLMDEVLPHLAVEGVSPELGEIVLAGHSGAYLAIGRCLAVGGVSEHINEVHLLDATYGQWEEIVDWVAADPAQHKLFSVFTNHLAAANVELITRLEAAGITTTLTGDRFETLGDGPWPPRVFVHAVLSDHGQAVGWLERSLRARGPRVVE
ncbi:MAG: hypothetical protein RLN76_07910 [Phycisphaeraceae bacterium]